MPRVFKQRANKAYPQYDIEKGDTYYKWSFRYGGTHKSKTPPRRSQLTQSKLGEVYAMQEALEDICSSDNTTLEDIRAALEDLSTQVETTAEEYHEAAESFGNQGENQERGDELESWGEEIASAISTVGDLIDRTNEVIEDLIDKTNYEGDAIDNTTVEELLEEGKEAAGDLSCPL